MRKISTSHKRYEKDKETGTIPGYFLEKNETLSSYS